MCDTQVLKIAVLSAYLLVIHMIRKAWKLYDMERREYLDSRDVIFYEDQFWGMSTDFYIFPPLSQSDFPIK